MPAQAGTKRVKVIALFHTPRSSINIVVLLKMDHRNHAKPTRVKVISIHRPFGKLISVNIAIHVH